MPPQEPNSAAPFAGPAAAPGPVEIRVEGLCKAFAGRTVLDGLNIKFRAGELVAIVGASGSGKTVFLDHLIGLMRPDSGRVFVADHDASPANPGAGPPLVDLGQIDEDRLDRIRLHWAVVFQRNALFTGSVRDNIALWLTEHTDLPQDQVDQRIVKSLEAAMLDVKDVIDKDRDALSGGMAKRVAIARAIAIDPLVVFYDEPTTGLDPVVGGHIHELIWRVHHLPVGSLFPARPGAAPSPASGASTRTTIVVTHDKDLLRRTHPRVIMLHEGRVCFDGPYEDFGGPGCPPARQYLEAMPVLHTGEAAGRRTRGAPPS